MSLPSSRDPSSRAPRARTPDPFADSTPEAPGSAARRSGSRRQRGVYGEQLAEAFLEDQGYRIVARNARAGRREIDRIALERTTLCFIEVRLRSSRRYGSAEESVDPRKQRQVVRAARTWLAERRARGMEALRFDALRFDVVTVDASRQPPELRLYRAAFGAGSR